MREPSETCPACRFDGAEYDLSDTLGTLRAVPAMWRQLVEGIEDEELGTRPEPGVWSASEYAAHSATMIETMGRLLHGTLVVDDLHASAPPAAEPDVSRGPADVIARLTRNVERLYRRALGIGGPEAPGWARTAVVGDREIHSAWMLRHAVHEATHHLSDAGRGLHGIGAGAPTQHGVVARLSVSGGGVPKTPVDRAEVTRRGLAGDRQADRRNHGRPLQALCIWSTEVIEALRQEGHPIEPGAAGENVTIRGIDWTKIRTGVQIRIGEALAEVSAFATPCARNATWFKDRDFRRMDHDLHPGWSRAYAWVRQDGTVADGDPVVVEP